MARIILGAIAGFVAWLILLIASDQIWIALSPDWFGKHQTEFSAAVTNKTPFTADLSVMIIAVVRSAIFTIVTGFIAAWISRESFKAPLSLGVLLLVFGASVHSTILANVPLWYHLLILVPLIPLAILGGKLKSQKLLI